MGRVVVSDIYPLADELRGPFLTLIHTRLATHVSLLILLKGENVNLGSDPADKPPGGRWVTMAYEKSIGTTPDMNEGWLMPRLWIKSECRRSEFSFVDAMNWHTDVHAVITTRLLNYRPALTGGANGGTGQVYQREDQSDNIALDADEDTYYFASFFSTRIIAAQV